MQILPPYRLKAAEEHRLPGNLAQSERQAHLGVFHCRQGPSETLRRPAHLWLQQQERDLSISLLQSTDGQQSHSSINAVPESASEDPWLLMGAKLRATATSTPSHGLAKVTRR